MIDGNEVLPRLWIGTCASCDEVRGRGFYCLNVLESPHCPYGCVHIRILGENGLADPAILAWLGRIIDQSWSIAPVLVHCGAGVERSPLVVATWMTTRFNLTLDQAYAWLKERRPQIEDRRHWIRGQ